jgi:DNA uptake protein ComE-like DNA-binding protein
VAASPKKTNGSADEWLVSESDVDSSPDPETNGGGVGAEWLVEPATDLNGAREAAPSAPAAKEERTPPPEDSFELTEPSEPKAKRSSGRKAAKAPAKTDQAVKLLQTENRELAKRIRELEKELRTQEKAANAEFAKALKEREAALTERFEEREEKLRERIDDAESALAEAQTQSSKSRRRKSSKEALDLNGATFEDLRDLGLSVTQSARVIAYRDTRGGYESLDELDEVPGLPKGIRKGLRAQLTLSS